MAKYRKKPVVIEAIQFNGENQSDIAEFVGEMIRTNFFPDILIETLEGTMKANIGDYIIKGIKGEFYPCKPDIFEATYEKVSDENSETITKEGRHLTPEKRIALQAEEIKQLQQEIKRLRKERNQAIRDIDKSNCKSCVYDGKKICYGNMHGKDREVAKEQGLPYCIGWQWRGLEGNDENTETITKETSLSVIVESLIEGTNSFIMKCPSCNKKTISSQQAYIHDNIKREWYCKNCGQKLNNHNLLKEV